MKILYTIQTTGNGHLSRARKLIPEFSKHIQVDVITSGPKNDFPLDHPITKHYIGLTLYYQKNGGVNWWNTLLKNNFLQFFIDVITCPIRDYDLIINDFEPVTAWACLLKNKKCIGLSNQFGLNSPQIPRPKSVLRNSIKTLKLFAPVKHGYGFHYKKYNDQLFYPIIREEVLQLNTTLGTDIVAYLPAYNLKQIKSIAQQLPQRNWHIFSTEVKHSFVENHLHMHPVDAQDFLKHLGNCWGVVTAAGFTTTSEALFLGKPLLVVPTKAQIEQAYNAAALKKLGVTVIKKLHSKQLPKIQNWMNHGKIIRLSFKDETSLIVERILLDFIKSQLQMNHGLN